MDNKELLNFLQEVKPIIKSAIIQKEDYPSSKIDTTKEKEVLNKADQLIIKVLQSTIEE